MDYRLAVLEGCDFVRKGRSMEDYLEAILILTKERGTVRSIDVAEYLSFSKPSVSKAMGLLVDDGLISFGDEKQILLTEKGSKVAGKIYEKHLFFADLFEKVGVERSAASEQACMIEHVMSDDTFERIRKAFSGKPCSIDGVCPGEICRQANIVSNG